MDKYNGYIRNHKDEVTCMDRKYDNHNSFYIKVDDTKKNCYHKYESDCNECLLLIAFIIGILFCRRCYF